MQFLLLILGLGLIVKSADILIDSAAKIARRYGVSSFIIGITVIAFGTSAPELAVGILSGISQTNQLTLGNIIGSCLSNIALIVGLSAMIFPLMVKDTVVKRELPMLIIIQVALGAMMFIDGQLSRIDGIILMGSFVAFMVYIFLNAKKSMKIQIDPEGDIDTDNDGNRVAPSNNSGQESSGMVKLGLFSIISLIGLFGGGKLTVDSSTQIAQSFGLSETMIGLTVLALATTMPELITSIVAARKKEHEIVLGNCIGSCILNILLVLGLSSFISPIAVEGGLWFDFISMLALAAFVFFMSFLKKKIQRPVGIVLVAIYVIYITTKVMLALT